MIKSSKTFYPYTTISNTKSMDVNNIWVLFKILMIVKFNTNVFFNALHYYKSNIVRTPPILKMISSSDMNTLSGKKILSISPGGYKGFYVLGICKFIKETYNLSDFVFSGASAGAWNSLILSSKVGIDDIQKKILDIDLINIQSARKLELAIKNRLLENYKSEDFELHKLYIGVTALDNYKPNTIIYNGFENLEDAIDCCIASSHIPFFTGGLTNVYRNTLTFDGGFSRYPYLNATIPNIHIHPNIWNRFSQEKSIFDINGYTSLLSKHMFPFEVMIQKGYEDALVNKNYLDSIFIEKYIEI